MRYLSAKNAAKRAAEKVKLEEQKAKKAAKILKTARLVAAKNRDIEKLELVLEHATMVVVVAKRSNLKFPPPLDYIYAESKDLFNKIKMYRLILKVVYNNYLLSEMAVESVKKHRQVLNRRLQNLNAVIAKLNKRLPKSMGRYPKFPML